MNFDERQAIHQSFPFQSFSVNTFPMKATINSSKFCSSKFLTCSIRQISSDFSTVKVLRYTVYHTLCQIHKFPISYHDINFCHNIRYIAYVAQH